MIGAIVIAVVVIVLIPVGFLMSMTAVSAIFGTVLKNDAEARAEGSELIELNR